MTRSRFRVTGRVQGVGFRSWTCRTARALGLAGWVRNLPDGSVELEARGPDERMDTLREALWKGPMFANVTGVDEQPHPDSSDSPDAPRGPVEVAEPVEAVGPVMTGGTDAPGTRDGQSAPLHDFHVRF